MTSKNPDSSSQVLPQGDNAAVSGPQAGSLDHQGSRNRNQVLKSGPLFISSKGIGWTSWKKRWFILTRTSLVFFRTDPSATSQKVGEVNLTLGGIDLNNSASVEVKVDKKLLTVFFPDGRDGRAFTLKAETLEDLQEWKTALENALQQAPSATQVAPQNGLHKNEQPDAANGSTDQQKDKSAVKSMVIGRPILLALEDIDGSPSFLEKALIFVEDHGVKVEGILRQAADVDDVYRRVREYEQGKTDFSPEEDAHVIADCIKYILRELPSSPVPASCCNALLEAFRTGGNNRLDAMRTAILETFPEPNRRLLQRILLMMQTVVSNKTVNRMSTSAVAACMSPLLLRPLLAGDCELENTHMDVAGDGSLQLLQAAAAANHAQAIIITLLDEYDNIFGEGSMSGPLFSDSEESGTETEEATDDEIYDDDDEEYDDDDDDDDEEEEEHEDASDVHDDETEGDYENSVTESGSESGDHAESDSYDERHSRSSTVSQSPERAHNHIAKQRSPSVSPRSPVPQNDNRQGSDNNMKRNKDRSYTTVDRSCADESVSFSPRLGSESTKILGASHVRHPRWGRTSAKKNLSMESIDFSLEDEDDEIQRLEDAKAELQNRIAEEANGNAILQASLERRKKALQERRVALEKDVSRLQEQLQKEKDLRAALEAASNASQIPSTAGISEKTKNELEQMVIAEENFNNLKQRFDDLGEELHHQREHNAALMLDRTLELHDSSSCDNDRRNESSLSDNDHNQQLTSQGGFPKFGGLPNNSPSTEASATKPSPSTSRKSSSKGEGSNTSSALSKITNRLNMLKERRNQIAKQLQYIDKTKGFSSNQPALSPGKGKAPELPIISGTDKNHGSGNQEDQANKSSHSPRKGNSNEGDKTEGDNKDRNKKGDNKRSSNSKSDTLSYGSCQWMPNEGDSKQKSDNKRSSYSKSDASSQNMEQGRKSEYQSSQHLDRIKSDGQASRSSEKGRQQDGQYSSTSRTFSR